jgi:glycosyltransferase involved in cell wall biosynthesis
MNRNVNLLYLLFNQIGKGTYWRGLGFAQELAKQHYNSTVIAVSPNHKRGIREQKIGDVTLIETPDLYPRSGYDLWDILNRIVCLRKKRFDIIHAFETRPVNIFPALFSQKKDSSILVTDWCDWFGRGGSVEQRKNPVLRHFLRPIETYFEEGFRNKTDGTTVINTVLKRKAIALGIPPEKILHLPNGANVTEIKPQDKSSIRNHLGLPLDVPILAYTGAIFRGDAQLMANAFEKIYLAYPQAKLLLIGYNNVEIETWLPEAKDGIIRTGQIPFNKLTDYIAAADIGWLPLMNTGANQGRFPMKLFDFMTAARPVVVTDVGDVGEFVQSKQVGLVASDETSAFVQATLKLIQNQELQLEMGGNGRFVAENELAWPIVTKKLDTFYQSILHKS